MGYLLLIRLVSLEQVLPQVLALPVQLLAQVLPQVPGLLALPVPVLGLGLGRRSRR